MGAAPDPDRVRGARMISLLLATRQTRSPVDVVEWFGAMQAQDVASGQWSVGVRMHAATVADVDRAFESRELIRTWPMRQTVHIIPATDASWMLELTGRRRLGQMVERRQGLGLLPRDLAGLEDAVQRVLAAGKPVARKDVMEGLAAEGIPVDGQRGYHVLLYASLIGLTCIGPQRASAQTFALMSAWAGKQRVLTRDEALTELAYRYFRSHGPTGIRDFAGWTGLTLTDARRGTSLNEGRLVPLASGAEAPWATPDVAAAVAAGDVSGHPTVALPGYDEYILGYKDRSLHGDDTLLERIVPGGNGVFRATVVMNGSVVATWTRTIKGDRVAIEVVPLTRLSTRARRDATRALEAYAAYLGRTPTVTVRDPA